MPVAALHPETEQGKALFEELLWVHRILRRDLDTVERLAHEVASGMSGQDLEAELRELKTSGPLWQLKVSCLRYCRFVHMHHNAEGVLLFPALRAADASIAPVVDRLDYEELQAGPVMRRLERFSGI